MTTGLDSTGLDSTGGRGYFPCVMTNSLGKTLIALVLVVVLQESTLVVAP